MVFIIVQVKKNGHLIKTDGRENYYVAVILVSI